MNIDDLHKIIANVDAIVLALAELEKVKSRLGNLKKTATKSKLVLLVGQLEAISLDIPMVNAETGDAVTGTDDLPF